VDSAVRVREDGLCSRGSYVGSYEVGHGVVLSWLGYEFFESLGGLRSLFFPRASVAGHNDFPVLGFFPGWVFVPLREFCFVCVSFFNCFLNVFWLFL
jgi:hypothetical protein